MHPTSIEHEPGRKGDTSSGEMTPETRELLRVRGETLYGFVEHADEAEAAEAGMVTVESLAPLGVEVRDLRALDQKNYDGDEYVVDPNEIARLAERAELAATHELDTLGLDGTDGVEVTRGDALEVAIAGGGEQDLLRNRDALVALELAWALARGNGEALAYIADPRAAQNIAYQFWEVTTRHGSPDRIPEDELAYLGGLLRTIERKAPEGDPAEAVTQDEKGQFVIEAANPDDYTLAA